MRIAIVQTRPARGDIAANITGHQRFIDAAARHDAEMVVFPELSLTGYEPALADRLAISPQDPRLDVFEAASAEHGMVIGAGAPIRAPRGVCIGMVVFQPQQPRQLYAKKYLHRDEEPFFVSGSNLPVLTIHGAKIALAICYEVSVPQHAEDAAGGGAQIYLASVAKTASGVANAMTRLPDVARTYSMTVLMANCIGESGDGECAGQSAVWSNRGVLLEQLDQHDEGLLLFDTGSSAVSRVSSAGRS